MTDYHRPGSGNDPSSPASSSATRARQGVTGHGVRYVLGFSLGGVVIAMLQAAWYFHWTY